MRVFRVLIMACCNPLLIKNNNTYSGLLPQYYSVPCGYCLNCRVDRRNELEVYCEDLETRYRTGTFLTLTYDDNHIVENPFNEKLSVFSLTKKHLQDFNKRIRSFIFDNKLNDDLYINQSFKYLAVGEYGHDSMRNHFHILYFGLDYKVAESIFLKCWDKGNIYSLPIKKGAFRYVLKYLDKQVKGSQARALYDDYGLERPFCCHSKQFGRGFIEDNLDFILSNDGCFLGKKNKLVPISSYYKRKLSIPCNPNYYETCEKMIEDNVKRNQKHKAFVNGYSLNEINKYKKKKNLLREKKLIKLSRDDNIPVDDWYLLSHSLPNEFLEFAKYGDVVPF